MFLKKKESLSLKMIYHHNHGLVKRPFSTRKAHIAFINTICVCIHSLEFVCVLKFDSKLILKNKRFLFFFFLSLSRFNYFPFQNGEGPLNSNYLILFQKHTQIPSRFSSNHWRKETSEAHTHTKQKSSYRIYK